LVLEDLVKLNDSSFSELSGALEWGFKELGKAVLTVPAYNTSRECFR